MKKPKQLRTAPGGLEGAIPFELKAGFQPTEPAFHSLFH